MEELPSQTARGRGSAVDRLIQLAGKAPEKTPNNLVLEDTKEVRPPMWRALLQLRVLLPYVSRLLPLLEGTSSSPAPVSQEFRHGIAEIQTSHRDLRLQIQDQSLQLKRVEEQLLRLRENNERNDFEHSELVEDVKSISTLLRVLFGTVAVLLLVLIAMVGFLLLHVRH